MHGSFIAEIYVDFFRRSLPGFDNAQEESKLKKTLYGLVRLMTIWLTKLAVYLFPNSSKCSILQYTQAHQPRPLGHHRYPIMTNHPDLDHAS